MKSPTTTAIIRNDRRSIARRAFGRLIRAISGNIVSTTKLKSFGTSNPTKLSNDELLAFMRHDAHRIEKSFYNRIFYKKQNFYANCRRNVRDCIALLKQRGFDTSERTLVWADAIANHFDQLELGFIQPNSTNPKPIDPNKAEEFIKFIASRRSTRVWSREQPSKSMLIEFARKMIDAGSRAPNSGNRQPWRFLILVDEAEKHLLMGIKEQHCYDAPCLIFVGSDRRLYGGLGKNEAGARIDAGAAAMQMVLTAHAGNFGVCWNHFSRDLIVSRKSNRQIYANFVQVMQIPDYIEPIAIIAFGVAAFHPPAPPRMAVDSLLLNDAG